MRGINAKHLKMKTIPALVALSLVSGLGITTVSADVRPGSQCADCWVANNENCNSYTKWSEPAYSNLIVNSEGYMKAEYGSDKKIHFENYNRDLALTFYGSIEGELDKFGGLYASDTFLFAVYGADNPSNNDKQEVIRIVKYDYSWNRISACSIVGANTAIPFDSGSCRMSDDGKNLYILTSHKMYNSHQSNMFIKVRISDMNAVMVRSDVSNVSTGYVSHSFNQFIKFHSGKVYTLDHGDSYPRGAVIGVTHSQNAGASLDSYFNLIDYYGSVGEINTNACIGGLEVNDNYVATVGRSTSQKSANGVLQAYISITPVRNFNKKSTKINWVTGSPDSDTMEIGNPQIVGTGGQECLVVIPMYSDTMTKLKFVKIDSEGNISVLKEISDKAGSGAGLSDCQIEYDPMERRVVWYTTNGTSRINYYDLRSNDFIGRYIYSQLKNQFSDIDLSKWYAKPNGPIEYVVNNKIMSGVGDNKFSPEKTCTREMMVTILYNLDSNKAYTVKTKPFKDVKVDQWYTDPIYWAYANNITSGVGNNKFGIGKSVTRQEMAKLLMTYAKYCGIDVSNRKEISGFKDAKKVASWAKEAMQWANANGIINGKSSNILDPEGRATRAEVAQMIMNFRTKFAK